MGTVSKAQRKVAWRNQALQRAKLQMKASRYCTLSERLFYYAHQVVIMFIGVITLKGDIDFE